MPIEGDRRAWYGVATLDGRRLGCEAETRLQDIQALQRRLALKARDGQVDMLILVISNTPRNRDVLERHRESLRELLPLDSRVVLAGFRSGRLPERSGIVVL